MGGDADRVVALREPAARKVEAPRGAAHAQGHVATVEVHRRPCRLWAPGTLTLIVTESRAWLEPGVGVTAEMRGAVTNSKARKAARAQSATTATIRKR